jgi:hypothetical protein
VGKSTDEGEIKDRRGWMSGMRRDG